MKRFVPLILFVTVALVGCGKSDAPEKVTVSGEVTVDGKPLPEGEIIFRSEGGSGRAEAGTIKDGKYELKSLLGKMKVEIRAMRQVPGSKAKTLQTGESDVPLQQYIAEEFNDKSTLTADVTESDTSFSFAVKAKSK